eukprot:m.46018 g.46018  ORF g.46018 m.46018 type:complete len:407 (-) comp12217_c0_seq4:179-1399(-)
MPLSSSCSRLHQRALIACLLLLLLSSVCIRSAPLQCSSIQHSINAAGSCACEKGYKCVLTAEEDEDDELELPCAYGLLPIAQNEVLLHAADRHLQKETLDMIPPNCKSCRCRPGHSLLPRIVFASVPRSGNSWTRKIIELATGLATETVFPETFTIASPANASERLTRQSDLNPLTGLYGSGCGIVHACGEVHRVTKGSVVTKTHSPFLLTKEVGRKVGSYVGTDAGVGTFLLLVVRNPLDNYDAWCRYLDLRNKERMSLDKFLDLWIEHHRYWQETEPFKSLPKYVFRFEDMGSTSKRVAILQQFLTESGLAASLGLTNQSIEAAVRDPRVRLKSEDNHTGEEHLADAFLQYSWADISRVRAKAKDLLEKFGYLEVYNYWSVMQMERARVKKTLEAIPAKNWASP